MTTTSQNSPCKPKPDPDTPSLRDQLRQSFLPSSLLGSITDGHPHNIEKDHLQKTLSRSAETIIVPLHVTLREMVKEMVIAEHLVEYSTFYRIMQAYEASLFDTDRFIGPTLTVEQKQILLDCGLGTLTKILHPPATKFYSEEEWGTRTFVVNCLIGFDHIETMKKVVQFVEPILHVADEYLKCIPTLSEASQAVADRGTVITEEQNLPNVYFSPAQKEFLLRVMGLTLF
ncbi:hypothetical protein H0H93_008589 [Arthromyces matolae]|nr:hypothetical protein H0H93_008589 [Arthromyces matolae]